MKRLIRPAELVLTYGPAAYILVLPLELSSVWLRQQLSRYVLVALALAFAFLVLTRRRSLSVPRSWSIVFLVLYVVASLVSWALTRSPGSVNSAAVMTLYPLVAVLLANLVLTDADHRRAWTAFLVAALVIAMLGATLYFLHWRLWEPNPLVAARLNITFGDPNITARFLTLGACAAMLMYAERKGPSWLAMSTAAACAFVIPMTLSRSAFGLFVLTVLIAVVLALNHRRAAAIAAVAIFVFAASTAVNSETRLRAEDAAATVVSLATGKPFSFGATSGAGHATYTAEDNRRYLIAAGIAMFKDHPVAGVGFGGYQRALQTTYSSFLPSNRSGPNLDTLSHAALVTVLAEQGVTGTALLLAFLVVLAWEAWRARRRRDEWSVWSTIPATLVIPIFLYSQIEGRLLSEPYFWLSLGLLYAAASRAGRERAISTESMPSHRVELAS